MLGLGDLGNIPNMMRNVQQMQQQMGEMQDKLAELSVTGEAGGGMVGVTANGKGDVVSVTIDPSIVNGDDHEMLQELVAAAINQALAKARELSQQEMSSILGGANIPPGMLNMLGITPEV
jgi:nucleoid-associated protein EbfC